MEIRAWDPERQEWLVCTKVQYVTPSRKWAYVPLWSDGDEGWLFDLEIRVDGVWRKLNE